MFAAKNESQMSSVLNRMLKALWLISFFVSPLLFFTNLTRNPYVTQTILLDLALLAALAVCALQGAWKGEWSLPATSIDMPLVMWLAVCVLSWSYAYTHHVAFFRGSMRAEGLRVMAFTLVGTILPFYMGVFCARESGAPGPSDSSLKKWMAFFLVWGGLWVLFPGLRSSSGSPLSLDGHLWDPYGGLLWIGGFLVLLYLARTGTVHDYWQVALGVAFLSSLYGICQYFNVEIIWPKSLNPYGGRSVSTFGNPNFMSSYMVVFLPVAVLYYLKARQGYSRWIYAAVCLAIEGSLLSSLTRSSWLGAAVGLGVLLLSKTVRNLVQERAGSHMALLAIAIIMAMVWPHSSVLGLTPTVFGRVAEMSSIFDAKAQGPYSPFYQRVLMWTCAWTMGKENPLLGKGWGLFEMFYPFYQGPLLAHFDYFRTLRTHGNNAHNEILEVWAQMGLLGVGVLFWIWTTFFASVKKWMKSSAGSEWMIAAAAGVAGMLADNMFNVSLHMFVPAFMFWWQAGVVMGLAHPIVGDYHCWRFPGWKTVADAKSSSPKSPTPFQAPVRSVLRLSAPVCALVVVLSCAWAGWWYIRQWNREVYYFAGFKLFHNGQLSPAVEMLESAYRWHGREVNTDYELGNAYARSGSYDRAVWAYHEALESNAGYDEIYYNTATVLAQHLDRPDEALTYFRTAHWINPLWKEAYIGLSTLYLKDLSHYRESAVSLLEQAVHFFPDNAAFLANLAYLYGLNHDEAKAETLWIRALKINPELSIAEQNLRIVLNREGKSRDPFLNDLALYHHLVNRIARKDYSTETVEEARKAVAAFPECPKPRFILGSLEMTQGHPEEALKWLEPLVSLDSGNASLYQNLGEIYLRLGRRQDAASAFHMALQIDPGNRAARERLSQLGQI